MRSNPQATQFDLQSPVASSKTSFGIGTAHSAVDIVSLIRIRGGFTMTSLVNLPITLRALFSGFLIVIGIGYLNAVSYLFLVDVQPGQQAGERLVESISE